MNENFPSYAASIHHDGSARYVHARRGELRLGDEVLLRLRAAPDAPIDRIFLRTSPDGEQHFAEMQPLEPGQAPGACQWWQVGLRLVMPATGYRFLLFTAGGAWWYNGTGLHRGLPTDADDFTLLAGYQAPGWVYDSVFYQVFPDRFADGDPSNNVKDGEWVYAGQPSTARRWGESPAAGGRQAMVEFFGGDLLGLESRLDYLQDLGANAIYLNPVFTAQSNHRYDVTDYFNVDPHLGGNPALASLREATRARRMRFILDIVPNHCGVFHPWFQVALADPQAPSADYFTFYSHPQEYASWLGVRTLPKLNYRSQALREVMYAGPQSVFRYWLQPPYSLDGWRLDVANMLARQGADQLGLEVGRGIRLAVKSVNPEAYLLGENFFDASAQLQGDLWDAAMNYSGFSKPLRYWLSGFQIHQHAQPNVVASDQPWTTQAMVDSWHAFRAAIPWVIARQQFNLLGSHDTPRILTQVGGNPALNRLAATVLFTYPGVPSVYYGDEVGLQGHTRAPMPWDPAGWDGNLRQFYRSLIHLRRTSPALIDGGFQVLLVEENTVAYLRDANTEQLVVVAHRGPASRPAGPLPVAHGAIPDGAELVELFSGRRAVVQEGALLLPTLPTGVQVWRLQS